MAWVFSSMKPIHDLHAGAFEIARPADIGLLVEARLQLDHRGHRFAGFGRFGERPDDRRIGRGAVERLLDRDDVGIARGLLQEIHHHVEGFEGVVNDEILLPDGGEAVAAMVAHALGIARRVGHEFEVGPVETRQLRHLVERQHAVDLENALVGDAERALTKLCNSSGIDASMSSLMTMPRRRRLSAVSNSRTRSSASSRISTSESRMTRKAPTPLDRIAGKQLADEQAGGAFDRDQPHIAAVAALRQPDEALDPAAACGSARSSPARPWRATAAAQW